MGARGSNARPRRGSIADARLTIPAMIIAELDKQKERAASLERELKKAQDVMARSKNAKDVATLQAENRNFKSLLEQTAREHKEQVEPTFPLPHLNLLASRRDPDSCALWCLCA